MATSNTGVIIKRSFITAIPEALESGELAYSYVSNTMFIGSPEGDSVLNVAGFIYTDAIDKSTSDNIPNTLVKRDANGNFYGILNTVDGLVPGFYGGVGSVPVIEVAANGRIMSVSNSSSVTSFTIEANTGSNTFTGGTLRFEGGTPGISTVATTEGSNTVVTFNLDTSAISIIDQYVRDTANAAAANTIYTQGVDATQNNDISILQGVNLTQNTNISVLQGINDTQNTNISDVNALAVLSYNKANAANVLAQSAFDKANSASISSTDQYARDTANSASYNTIYTQGVDATQNTYISELQAVNLTQNASISAIQSVNSSQSNDISILQGINLTQNTDISILQGVNLSQNSVISSIQGVDLTQNTRITSADDLARSSFTQANAAFNQANVGATFVNSGGTVSGNVSITKNLTVTGNLNILGNTTSISVTELKVDDTLIYLGANNYYSDVVDIGIIGHYNDGANAHTGIFRDPNLKEWIFFKNYTPEIEANNLIDINDASFQQANVYAAYVKGNLIGQNVVVNGLSLYNYVTSSYGKANTVGTLAQASFDVANSASSLSTYNQGVDLTQNTNISAVNTFAGSGYSKANSANVLAQASFDTANSATSNTIYTQGVDSTQNTNISSVNTFAGSAYDKANSANVLAQAAFDKANNVIDQTARDTANSATSNTIYTQGVDVTQNTNISSVNTFAGSAYDTANLTNVLAQAAFDKANTSITADQYARDTANSASANTIYTQGVDATQNTDISNVITNAQAAFNKANTDVTNVSLVGSSVGSSSQIPVIGYAANGRIVSAGVASPQVSTGTLRGVVVLSDSINSSSNVSSGNAATPFAVKTAYDHAQQSYNQANASNALAQASFNVANTTSDNIVYIQGINDTQNTNISSVNTFAGSSYNKANSANVLAQAAFDTANSATTGVTYINGVNSTQNTNILSVNTFAGSAYDKANSANVLAQDAYNKANNVIDQTARDTANSATASITYIDGVNTTQNTNIGALNTFAGSAYNHANTATTLAQSAFDKANTDVTNVSLVGSSVGSSTQIPVIGYAANGRIISTGVASPQIATGGLKGVVELSDSISSTSSVSGANAATPLAVKTTYDHAQAAFNESNTGTILAQAAFDKANTSITSDQYARDTANSASSNTIYLDGVNVTQNNNIGALNTFTSSAYNEANAANILAQAAFNSGNNTISYVQGVNDTQNTRLTSADDLARSAFTQANVGATFVNTGGTVSGNVSITKNLTVTGNLNVLGNTTVISVTELRVDDTLLYLGANNYYSDAVDIGIIGNYNDGANAHTGIFRDPNLKEWLFFKDYTPEVEANNLIDINDPSFHKANVHADYVKGNLIASTVVVNGLNLYDYTTSSYDKANTVGVLTQATFHVANTASANTIYAQGVNDTQNTNISSVNTYATSAYDKANASNILAQAGFDVANTAYAGSIYNQGVNDTQNTNIGAVNTYATSAYDKANTTNILAQASYDKANSANVLAQSAYDTANTKLNITGGTVTGDISFTGANIALGNIANVHLYGGNTGQLLTTDNLGNLSFIDLPTPNTVTYTANSLIQTNGVYVSGNLWSTQVFGDYASSNGSYVLTDGSGSAPAWYIDFDFLNVVKFNRVVMNINYTASSGHTIYVQLYNYVTSTWDSIGTYTGLGSYYAFALEVIDEFAYVDTGRVQLRLYHSNQGNIAHQTSIDYVSLEQSYQGPQGPRGPTGATGATGATGNGVSSGGTTGQVLIKNSSTNYDTSWSNNLIDSYNKANASNILAQAAYDVANTSSANTIYTQGVDSTQNTNIIAVNTFAVSAYNVANSGVVLAQAAFDKANTGISSSIDQYARDTANTSSANTIYTQGVDFTQNTNISSVNTFASSAYDKANSANVLAQAAFNVANTAAAGSMDQYARDTANSASSNTVITQGVDATQNAAISIIQGVDLTQNTNITAVNNYATSSYGHANAAFNQANVGASFVNTGGTVSGNVTFTKDVSITGNLYLLGNATTINTSSFSVDDSLIILGIGNYVTDILDIGFAGHYNNGTNAHTGIIRDAVEKEFYVFDGYTPELSTNNNIDINDASFNKANLNAGVFKGNLIGSTAVVNGLELYSYTTSAYAKANTVGTLAQASFDVANTSYTNTVYNQGVDLTQNTNISSVNTFAGSAYNKANSANLLAQAAFDKANTSITADQYARDTANSASANTVYNQNVDLTQNTNITAVNTFAGSAYSKANSANVLAQAAFDKANNSISADQYARDTANSASANTIYTEGVDLTQNTNISAINTFAGSAYDKANSANSLAQAAFDKANTGGTGSSTDQYARDTANTALENTTYNSGVNVTQNNSIVFLNSYTQAAFDKANTGSSSGADQFARDTANSKTYTFYQNTAPSTSNAHDLWVNSNTGVVYENFGSTSTPVWAEFGPSAISNTSNVYVNTLDRLSNLSSSLVLNNDGSLKFNNGTIQTTAYTGFGIDNVARTTANAALANTSGTFGGNLTVAGKLNTSNNITINYTPSTTVGVGIAISSGGTVGGAEYADFLRVTNNSSGATNPSKTFRLNGTGGLEVINSAYNANLFTLDDNGNITIPGNAIFNGIAPGYGPNRPAFKVIGNGGAVSATTTMTGSNWTIDYNQGGYLNNTTGIFTAPVAGLYQVNVVVRTNSNTNPTINQIIIRKTAAIGGSVTSQIMVEFGVNTTMNHTGGSAIVQLSVGDTLKFDVTSGAISFDGNDNWSVAYIG